MGLRLNCSRGFAFSRWAKKQAEFCNQFRQRRRIAGTGKHVFAVINGVVHVEAPPDCGRCIYGAWEVVGRSTSERPIPHITAFPRTS
jgi:hypothetical protein